MEKAKKLGMKIIVDSLTRVSSARMHKKYKKFILNTMDA